MPEPSVRVDRFSKRYKLPCKGFVLSCPEGVYLARHSVPKTAANSKTSEGLAAEQGNGLDFHLSDLPRCGFRNPVKNAEPLEVMLPIIRNVQ